MRSFAVATAIVCLGLVGCGGGSKTDIANKVKAVAVLHAVDTGSVASIRDFVGATYEQHNPNYEDGAQFMIDAIERGYFDGTRVETYRSFTDKNVVVFHSRYYGTWNNNTPQMAFDVFRLQNGKIVEHWDNFQDVEDDGDQTTQFNGDVTSLVDIKKTDENKELVKKMSQDIYIDGNFSKVDEYFDVEGFIQHRTGWGEDFSAFSQYLDSLPEGTQLYHSIKFVYASGNFVLMMSQGISDVSTGFPSAHYDLFRLKSGKIVEHWDVVQEIPPESDWRNSNGKW